MDYRHRFRSVLALALLAGGWIATCPATAGLLTLAEAFDLALGHDAEIAAARERRSAEQEVYDQSRARLLPRVELGASTGIAHYEIGLRSARAYDNDRVTLSLLQPLFQKEYWSRLGQAESRVQFSDLDLQDKLQTLALDVAQSYFRILLAQRTVQLAEAEAASYQQLWEKISKSLAYGFSSRTDLLDAKARVDQAQAQVVIAKNNLQTARLQLQLRIGRAPDDVTLEALQLTDYRPEPVAAQPWLERIAEANLTVRKALLSLAIADAERDSQQAGHYPQVDLRASLSNSYNQDPSQIQGDDARISLDLTLPLFEGGGTASRVRQAAFGYSEAQQTLRAARERAQLDANRVLDDLATAQAAIVALKSSVASWAAFVESAEKIYRLGLKDLFNVLDARARLFAAQRDLASRVHDELLNRLQLYALVGELDREHMTAIDERLLGKGRADLPRGSVAPGAVQ